MRVARTSTIIALALALAAPPRDVTRVWAGDGHACAQLASRQARCWGLGFYGAIGDGGKDDRGPAVAVRNASDTGPLRRVSKLGAGSDHTCAVLASTQVRCWGNNLSGQLGDGTKDQRELPVTVLNGAGSGPLEGVVWVAAGSGHTCALLGSGRVRCWGANQDATTTRARGWRRGSSAAGLQLRWGAG